MIFLKSLENDGILIEIDISVIILDRKGAINDGSPDFGVKKITAQLSQG